MDRPTYHALSALQSRDSAKRALDAAEAKLEVALAAWAKDRPTVTETMASRDLATTLRMALSLTGDLPVDSSPPSGVS